MPKTFVPPQFHPKYRPDIDGLRAIAVLAVLAFHAFPEMVRGGFIGVDIFFVISGYLISTIIFHGLDNNLFSFSGFYVRRIKRIFPALILVLIASFVFGWFVLIADEYMQLGKHMAAGAGFVSNLVLWNEAGYFDAAADTKPLLHLWSLGIEEQFYIVWPILLWISWRCKFNLLFIAIMMALASFALNVYGINQDAVATFYSPQTRFWELLSGSLLAWIALYKRAWLGNAEKKIDASLASLKSSNILSIIGFCMLAYGLWSINKDISFPGWWALIPVMGTVLIIAAGSEAIINRLVLSNPLIVWFGVISFPLYLWHWPLLSFARIIEGAVPSLGIRIGACLLAVLLAWVTFKLVESPIRFGKNTKASVVILLSLMTIVGYIGFNTYVRNGLSFRNADKVNTNRVPWYRGKEDWLFLGVADNAMAKLKLSVIPFEGEVEATSKAFSEIAQKAAQFNTQLVLIVGPDKSSIYPEYLPDDLVPSTKKYSSFFLDELKKIPHLVVCDPTDDLLRLKNSEGILYPRTDTHWNNKGSFLTYSECSRRLNLPIPEVEFRQGALYKGDLISTYKIENFPLHPGDSWDVVWKNQPALSEKEIKDEQKTAFGSTVVVSNANPLSSKYVWVVGDSFTSALRQYLNATFKEVRYVGHWSEKLKELPADLEKADRKPDMIVIVRVERSF
ncbi:acyltransferase family protein [Polynucleobacter sp. VK25]|uniref:acyltransferase family protein n=1 Tax=Polynucleobacter sp. VK25 TaxID=1758398 RepID=UPI001BFD5778|nr:acyltransferase family protein [Polynucleobacter sp. VK25]QWD68084.1 acyltransferase family protein [Polynucleobacter sp. VK25]